MGVQQKKPFAQHHNGVNTWLQRPQANGNGGVHARSSRKHLVRPNFTDKGVHSGGRPNIKHHGTKTARLDGLVAWFHEIQLCLRDVIVNCGSWERCVTPCLLFKEPRNPNCHTTAVFLDPP
jgi:hypothetical protein